MFAIFIFSYLIQFATVNTLPNTNTINTTTYATQNVNNLTVKYLVVVDSTVYNRFKSLYGNVSDSSLTKYIKIFYQEMVLGMNQRFSNSLNNDPNLIISISLVDVLVLKDPASTPWTNATLVSVSGYPIYNGKPTAIATISSNLFTTAMNKLKSTKQISFDYAIAFMDFSIFSNNSIKYSMMTYSITSPLCTPSQYTISSFSGPISSIGLSLNALSRMLGSPTDGSSTSITCPASANNVMAPVFGKYPNAHNSFYFSNCSINAFKSYLLTQDRTDVLPSAQCLLNPAASAIDSVVAKYLPGQIYSINKQCALYYGSTSTYSACYIPNDDICGILFCSTNNICTGSDGQGALDGTPCYTYGTTNTMICYQGKCVNASAVIKNTISSTPCSPNPCLNGGKCVTNNFDSLFICNCLTGYTGYTCDSPFQATTILVNSITTTITKVTTRTNTASTTTKATTTKSNTSTITVKTSSSGKMV